MNNSATERKITLRFSMMDACMLADEIQKTASALKCAVGSRNFLESNDIYGICGLLETGARVLDAFLEEIEAEESSHNKNKD